jgi:hypothetical protein
MSVSNFPTTDGKRISLVITSTGRSVTLTLGGEPSANISFQLPSFIDNVASTTSGTIDESSGTVTVVKTVKSVTVTLRNGPTG